MTTSFTPPNSYRPRLSSLFKFLAALISLNLLATSAWAVPSYARQTGMECAACHVGAFGPQLTPFGMNFKLRGYADSYNQKWLPPISAMVVGNWTHTKADQVPPPSGFNSNDNAVVQEMSLFLAGKLANNLGTFVQTTYSGVDKYSALDQVDIRTAHAFTVNGKELIAGLSLNNNPTITNPGNASGTWRFPFTEPDLAPSPANTTMLDDMLGQQVGGLNAYALWDQTWYAELGGYKTLSRSFLGAVNDLQDPADDVGRISGLAPYWRLGYQNNAGKGFYMLGLYGMNTDIKTGVRTAGGPYDKYRDLGIDGTYLLTQDEKHQYALNGSYTHETRTMDYSGSGNGHLNRLDLNGSLHYTNTYGLTAGYFDVRGNNNAALWGTGSGSPNSSGYLIQADWAPFGKSDSWLAPNLNLQLGLKYTYYSKFDGTSTGATDNNTFSVFSWLSF